MTTRYIVKLSGGCRCDGKIVDGEYGVDANANIDDAMGEAKWFADRTLGGSIRVVTPINDGVSVRTVEVVR